MRRNFKGFWGLAVVVATGCGPATAGLSGSGGPAPKPSSGPAAPTPGPGGPGQPATPVSGPGSLTPASPRPAAPTATPGPTTAGISLGIPAYAVSVLAGDGTVGSFGDGGPAASAQFHGPAGVAYDAAGNLYVADFTNQKVREISPGGTITTVAGYGAFGYSGDGGAATNAQLNSPYDVRIDAGGTLLIADSGNGRIRAVSPTGVITTFAGGGPAPVTEGATASSVTLSSPTGMALDRVGNLYVALYGGQQVVRIDRRGVLHVVAGNGTPGFAGDGGLATAACLYHPAAVAIAPNGNLMVADFGNNRIRQVDADGVITTIAGTAASGSAGVDGVAVNAQLTGPAGLAYDGHGNLTICDSGNNRIVGIDGAGFMRLAAGSGLNAPLGLAFDAQGRAAVADYGANQVALAVPRP